MACGCKLLHRFEPVPRRINQQLFDLDHCQLQQRGTVHHYDGIRHNKDSYNNDRPNLVPGIDTFLSAHRSRFAATEAWFNTAAFVANCEEVQRALSLHDYGGDWPWRRRWQHAARLLAVRRVTGTSILGSPAGLNLNVGSGLTFHADTTNAFNLVSLNAPGSSGVLQL